MPRFGMTIPFDRVSLQAQEEAIRELETLGYTDAWSSEAMGTDGLTPLALTPGDRKGALGKIPESVVDDLPISQRQWTLPEGGRSDLRAGHER